MTYGCCAYHEIDCDYEGNCINCPHNTIKDVKWFKQDEKLDEREVLRMNTIVEMRMDFINQFDNYIRNEIGDELITEWWLRRGLPDGADTAEIREIAEDDELWLVMVQCFAVCCKYAGKI